MLTCVGSKLAEVGLTRDLWRSIRARFSYAQFLNRVGLDEAQAILGAPSPPEEKK